jgi:hypothetical protein
MEVFSAVPRQQTEQACTSLKFNSFQSKIVQIVTLDAYLGDVQIWVRIIITQTQVSREYPQSPLKNPGSAGQLAHNRFLPHPFQFTVTPISSEILTSVNKRYILTYGTDTYIHTYIQNYELLDLK